jgi:RNA polymerase sigma factor (sigma-70 family)
VTTCDHDSTCAQPDAASPATTPQSTQAAAEELRLIQRIAEQDDEAFEILYQRYTPRLASFLFPWLHDATLVDEVINATLFVVWQKAAHFRPSTRLSTWLFGIARYKALKALKTSTAQSPDRLDPSLAEPGPADPETFYMHHEQVQIVAQALRTLPSDLREVVEGVYYHRLTYPELATHLGCSVSTVKSRMASARRRLAIQLRHAHRPPSGRGRADGHDYRTRVASSRCGAQK